MKCESLIRARWIPQVKLETGDIRAGYWKRLPDTEHCGESGMLYSIRKKAKYKTLGAIWVRTVLCDKHRKKAMREGNELTPVQESVETVNR